MSNDRHDERALAVLNRFGRALESDIPPEGLAQHLIEILEEQLGYQYGAVLLVDRKTAKLVPLALSAQGHDADFVERDRAYVSARGPRVGEGVTGWVAATGEAAHVPDVTVDARYTSMRTDIRSELCVPLCARDECVGVINIESPRANAYDEADFALLRTIAPHLAAAVRGVDLERRVEGSRVAIIELQDELTRVRGGHRALVNELNHRVRNNLASVAGLIDIARAGHDEADGLAAGLKRRVQSMAAVHGLLSATGWGPVELDHLFAALASRLPRTAFSARGPSVALSPDRITALGIAMTELIDESMSAGGLAAAGGSIEVTWTVGEGKPPHVEMQWLERGAVAPIAQRSQHAVRLVEGVLGRAMSGSVHWAASVGSPDVLGFDAVGA